MTDSSASSHPLPQELLRRLPSVERVLSRDGISPLIDEFGRALVTEAIRDELTNLRARVDRGIDGPRLETALRDIGESVASRILTAITPSLGPVVNATGIIVHTNLGRAPLSDKAIEAIVRVASGYSNLELDLDTGKRGSRHRHASQLLSRLFPGKDALIVNNAAAAVMLSLNTFAAGREVVISRGELVEIGGSFRVPDILERSGAKLREVGTTNKTRIADYREAIGERTGALLRVHPSNFRIVGFTESASTRELVELGAETSIPVIEDFGSGNLLPLARFGLAAEPTVQDSLASGVQLSIFSGDKLLGGPQAGILIGDADAIGACRKNPMARALRVDKLTYAALEATLQSFLTDKAERDIPVLRMLAAPASEVRARSEAFAETLDKSTLQFSVEESTSRIGGGAAADATIPTAVLAITKNGVSAESLQSALRASDPPVIARISEDRVLLDLRTVPVESEPALRRALENLEARSKS